MKVRTSVGESLDSAELCRYFDSLINRFFKILPMKENDEPSLVAYMQSLQRELIGCLNLLPEIVNNSPYITLLSILEYLCDKTDCSTATVKTEVFHAINICAKLSKQFAGDAGEEVCIK